MGSILTPRELEVLNLAKLGYSNKQIALRFGISDQTIKNHFMTIYDKLGVHNRAHAVYVGLRDGIIDFSEEE